MLRSRLVCIFFSIAGSVWSPCYATRPHATHILNISLKDTYERRYFFGGVSISNIRLTERDYLILREIDRWRCCIGRHVRELAGFEGQRATDRRLKKLLEAGFITRKKILYGVPSIYQLTNLGNKLIGKNSREDKIRVEQITHDICVIDAAISFLQRNKEFAVKNILTEKQLHSMDGFGVRKHRPDFVFAVQGKKTCVEVELSLKSNARFEAIVKDNYLSYDEQIWVVPDTQPKVGQRLNALSDIYTNIKIMRLEELVGGNEDNNIDIV